MFKLKKIRLRNKNLHSILVGSAIIMFWRGSWGLMDRYLFPENPVFSFFISITLGLVVLLAIDLSLEGLG